MTSSDRVETPQSACRAGVARCDITPPVGIYHRMWGAATHDRSTGVHRPLTATALALASSDAHSEEDPLVLVAIDHCLLWKREMQALLAATAKQSGVASKRLLFCFSHTHGAGLMGLERGDLPGGEFIAPYLDTLASSCAGIVRAACDALCPAAIVYGQGRCALAAHRDYWDEAAERFVCGFNPSGSADDTVLVARITADDGQVLATVVNYACHPTTLAWQNTLISPDYPGAMRELVEAATGAPCVFLQGASGELGPREGYVGDPAVADRNGRQLGYAALAALEALPPPRTAFQYGGAVISGATLGIWAHASWSSAQAQRAQNWNYRRWETKLAARDDLPTQAELHAELHAWQERESAAAAAGDEATARDCRARGERVSRRLVQQHGVAADRTLSTDIVCLQCGEAHWIFVESECYQALQTELRARHPGVPLVVVTLTNGWSASYLPPAEIYGRGIYQEQVSLAAPKSLERVRDEIHACIASVVAGPS